MRWRVDDVLDRVAVRRCARRSRSGAGPGSAGCASPSGAKPHTAAAARSAASAANTAASRSANRSSPSGPTAARTSGMAVEVRRRRATGEEVGLAKDGDERVDVRAHAGDVGAWPAHRRGRPLPRGDRRRSRSPWRAVSRSRPTRPNPTRVPLSTLTRSSISKLVISPVDGNHPAAGPRRRPAASIAHACTTHLDRFLRPSAAARPSATRSCSSTRSTPKHHSVTGCSTCSRVLTSRKLIVPSSPTRNSTVPAFS